MAKKTAEQMINYYNDSEAEERYNFLLYILNEYANSGVPDEQLIEHTKYRIEDDIVDRLLNEDENSIMLTALKIGFTEGYRKGMARTLRKYARKDY